MPGACAHEGAADREDLALAEKREGHRPARRAFPALPAEPGLHARSQRCPSAHRLAGAAIFNPFPTGKAR